MDTEIEEKLVALKCDSCGSSTMTMRKNSREGHGVSFSCLCDQGYTFFPDGRYNYVKATIFPSRMKEGDKMYRDEFLPFWEAQAKFISRAKYLAGFIDETEWHKEIKEIENTLIEWHENNPEKPWWKFW